MITLLAALAFAAPAQAADRPAYQREYLAKYDEARDRHGVDAPGCNLISDKYDNRCEGKATRRRVEKSTATLRRMLYVPRPVTTGSAAPSASASATTAASPQVGSGVVPADTGGGGCYGLPDYIVQRESGGDPNARNGQYGGCAQVDDSHFSTDCAGMSYGECVQELMRQGISKHWPTAANPPG